MRYKKKFIKFIKTKQNVSHFKKIKKYMKNF